MTTLMPLAVFENPLIQFGVNWHALVSQAIAFLILAFILNKFVFKGVIKAVADRQQDEKDAAENAQRIKEELAAVEVSRKEVMQQAQENSDRLVAETKTQVADLVHREKLRCEQLGDEMLAEAREEVLRDQARLKTELREEVAALVVTLTAKLTQSNLDAPERERLLGSAIEEINHSLQK